MRKYIITNEAMEAIRSRSEGRLRQTGVKQSNGDWRVLFDEDTIEQLDEMCMHGESMSETIIRLCSTIGKPQN